MENQVGSFTINRDTLQFNEYSSNFKATIKNTSLRSTSYDVSLTDNDHFKLIGNRIFTLAPGISKHLNFKHIQGPVCNSQDKRKKIIIINNSFGKTEFITCICPKFCTQQKQRILQYPNKIKIGQFNKKTIFKVPIINNSYNNLKLIFRQLQKPGVTFNILNESFIVLAGDSFELQIEVQKNQYGILQQNLQFQFTKEIHNNTNRQLYEKCNLEIQGDCTNRSLIVRDNEKQISQMKIECLNGTSKGQLFYLQNMFNQDVQYSLSASLLADTPTQYANKWRSSNIMFTKNSGIIKSRKRQKISFFVNTHYSQNDENYTKKYCKIDYSDDRSALALRNNSYSKKNIEFFIKICYKNIQKQELFQPTLFSIKCFIINPSIRFQLKQASNQAQVDLKIINQSRLSIPFQFSPHSLYRISHNKGQLTSRVATNINIKWTKPNQKCLIFMEIPDFNIQIYDPKEQIKQGTITRPASRRPMTSQKLFKNRFNKQSSTNSIRPISGIHSLANKYQSCNKQNSKCVKIVENIPKRYLQHRIGEDQLDCIKIQDRSVKNTHLKYPVCLQIVGEGYIQLKPGQTYFFEDDWRSNIEFKVVGYPNKFKINPIQQKIFNNTTNLTTTNQFSRENTENIGIKSSFTHKILVKQLNMSFKDHTEQFQIIDHVPIKNCSHLPLKINCLTIDNQFFHCKENNNTMTIPPFQVGKFKLSFMPKNTVSLRALANKPPQQNRRRAVVHTVGELEVKDQVSKVEKQIKFLINKKVEYIKCIGQVVQKRCTIKPQKIEFIGCRYGSAENFESFMMTCLSSKPIHFFIQHPPQVIIKPKKGVIHPKNAQNCTVYFNPTRKISNYEDKIKIYIGGSHTEIIPLFIDVEDPDIYIKEQVLQIQQFAICGSENQELNTEMTIVNNTLSQSFVQIDLNKTNLSLGYNKNQSLTSQMKLNLQSFLRKAKFDIGKNQITEQSQKESSTQNQMNQQKKIKKCLVNVQAGTFLRVPVCVKVGSTDLGKNILLINKNVCSLVGFGPINSPKSVSYNCQKTFLHIKPYKRTHDIILTKNQQGYKIQLKNTAKNTIKIRTELILVKNCQEDIPLICTYKDIDQYLDPEKQIEINMNFIFFDIEKNALATQYLFKIFVYETPEDELNSVPYYETYLNVFIPEPFLEISPTKLIIQTSPLNQWTRNSFLITNHGYKQILLKIRKPTNIAFELEYTMQPHDSNQKKKYKYNQGSKKDHNTSAICSDQNNNNKLTKINNCIQVKLSLRSKIPISFNVVLHIEDNFENKYEMFVAGTFTDSPFFILDNLSVNSPESMSSIYSSKSFNSNSFLNSSVSLEGQKSQKRLKDELEPIDVQDLLFLNNWLGSLIPELSGQSTFFYVWLTKIENFLKFLKQFNVQIAFTKEDTKKKKSINQDMTIQVIFQEMKKLGFHLNSLSIDLLQKADQNQWLNFMWFFFSKQILSSNLLSWMNKITNQKNTYQSLSRNYQTTIPNLIKSILGQNTDKISQEWVLLIDKYQPLLGTFKNLQSRRHLILSCNILYHKMCNIQKQRIQTSGFQMTLSIQNKQSRKVKYYLICDTKSLNCQQSSKKTMPSILNSGYAFTLDENQTLQLLLSFKNIQIAKKLSNMSIILINNIIWEPLTIYEIQFRKRSDNYHSVIIQCQERKQQQWVYEFQSKISSEYRVNLSGDPQFKLQTGNNLGYLKKKQKSEIRISYHPDSVEKHEAILTISNTLNKQIFTIKGKPLHSRKIAQQNNIRVTQNVKTKQIITVPWQIKIKSQNKPGSISSRIQKTNIPEFHVQFFNKTMPDIKIQNIEYNITRKEVKIQVSLHFTKKYRNLQILLRVYNKQYNQSKMIRLQINVAPKPMFIRAQIQGQDSQIIQNISVPNVYNINQNVLIEYRQIQNQQQILKNQFKKRNQYISDQYESPFQVLPHKNGTILRLQDNIRSPQFCIKFSPNFVKKQKQALFCVSLSYSQSLQKIYYIFIGTVINKLTNMFETQNTINYDICVLERVNKQLQIHNPKPFNLRFQVSTDLHQIFGKSSIIVPANSSSSYSYDIYCLHYGNKKGTITFRNNQLEYNYNISIHVKDPQQLNGDLKIYRQSYCVSSKIREKKTFTIQLSNSSQKNVYYQVISTSKYLVPLVNKINIPAQSEINLDVEYLPLFIGEEKGSIELYNPYQPQITYNIVMTSIEDIIIIQQIMPGIGEHKSIKLPFNNPTNTPAQIQLLQIRLQNNLISKQQWRNHITISQMSQTNSKYRNKYVIKQFAKCSMNVCFNPLKISENYSYQLIFVSKQIGSFLYKVSYSYPKQQLMTPITLHIQQDQTLIGCLRLLNRFHETLNLQINYDQSVLNLKNTKNCQIMDKHTISVKSLLEAQICFQAIPIGQQTRVIFMTTDHKFSWIFPITIYQVCQSIKQPITIKGVTNQSISTKIYPATITSISKIQLYTEQCMRIPENQITLNIKCEAIRNKTSQEKKINCHNYLSQNKLYEIQIQLYALKISKMNGFMYLYAVNKNQDKNCKQLSKIHQYKVQKIPYQIQIEESPHKVIVLTANVGEKAKVKLKLSEVLEISKNLFSSKFLDQFIPKIQIKLYNNKGNQFGAQLIQQQQGKHLEITYFAKEYSHLKRARLQIFYNNSTYIFILVGKYPQK